ncbi:MAG: heavy-metal-associated domain-containing protein [Chitinophagaceae bacterium]
MKMQSIMLSIAFLFVFGNSSISQTVKKENIKVWGNCGMCKKTIETAAAKAGAGAANWNTETKILQVSYNSRKTSSEKIQQAIAAAGYDTKDLTAPDAAYTNLHACCQYDRKADESNVKKDACCTNDKCSKDGCKDMDCCKGKDCCSSKEDAACCKNGACDKNKECCKDGATCKEKGCCK